MREAVPSLGERHDSEQFIEVHALSILSLVWEIVLSLVELEDIKYKT